jgi:uncharacterized protein (TIGR02996 family)
MADDAAFLDAIDARPDDDAPRLAHADWLEQHGDAERAQFIRAQLAGKGASGRWADGLPTVRGMTWRCRRGYPEVVHFESLRAFKEGWPLTAGRRVRHVQFFGLRGAKLADEPALASITSLELAFTEPAVILAILRSPRLGPLWHLAVSPRPVDHGFLAVLAAVPALAGLRSLEIEVYSPEPLEEGPVASLVTSPHLASLRSLKIRAWLGEGGMRALWRPSALAGLTSLELGAPGVSTSHSQQAGLDDLGDGAAMPGLERFVFIQSVTSPPHPSGVNDALAVSRATCWAGLRALDLFGAYVGDAGAVALGDAPHLSRLERLSLAFGRVSDPGAAALASSFYLRSLSSLDLRSNVIGRAGAAAFGRSTSLPRLRALSLAHNPAPAALVEAVEARFRAGGPPVEEEGPAPQPAVAVPPAPLLGHADEDALVRAIWADPFDEVPRLAYADWLDEQGKPLQAAVLRAASGEREGPAGRLAALMHKDAPCTFKPVLTDGLVRVAITARALRTKAFDRDGPTWLRRHHVTEVVLEGKTADMAALFAGDWLAHTRGLSFIRRPFDAWEALAGSPHLATLCSLDVVGSYMQIADKMFSRPGLGGLRGLCRLLVGHFLGPDALLAVCEAPFAPHLRHLGLGNLFPALRGMPILASAPALAGLVTLDLGRANLSDTCIKSLADATGRASLRNLDVSGGHFGDVGPDALAGSALLPGLARLRLSPRGLSAQALQRLARALPPRCRLVLAGEIEAPQRRALFAVVGERLVVEGA